MSTGKKVLLPLRAPAIEKERVRCMHLTDFLNNHHSCFFNVSGGCGYDMSHGKNSCMNDSGVWFKYCPFCGRKIVSKYNGNNWDWWEE